MAYMTDAQKTVSKSVTIDTPGRNGDFGLLFGAVNKDTQNQDFVAPRPAGGV